MADLLSPGINLKETNTQSTVVNNATGRAAMVGKFQWGPAYQPVQITREYELTDMFGGPDNLTADYFFSAYNFLQYGNDLRVVRAVNEEFAKNASPLVNNINFTITNAGNNYKVGDTIRVKYLTTVIEANGKVTSVGVDGNITGIFVPTKAIVSYAKSIGQYPDLSDSWTVEVQSASSGLNGVIAINGLVKDSGILLTKPETSNAVITSTAFQAAVKKFNMPAIVALYPGERGDNLEVEIISKKDFTANALLTVYPEGGTRGSVARAVFGYGPQTDDQYAIIVRLNDAIVESFVLSTKEGEKDIYGNNIFMDDYFANGASGYVFATSQGWPKGFSGIIKMAGGVSANDKVTAGDLMKAWDVFADRESLHVNLMIAGACAGEGSEIASTVQKHVVAIGDERQDCLVWVSPPKDIIVSVDEIRAVDNLVNWRNGLGNYEDANMNVSTTYAAIDGNYKYQYDKYNDVNRWVPLAADMAGLCAHTDNVAYPWMSPAGYNRGQIRNCIKLAIEPRQSQRDRLYQEAINPVVGALGNASGFVLYGDKTATTVPSPFDRINVRRLSNMLKKNIGDAAKYRLFETNTAFTRNSFRMEQSQYLGGIKSLGGVYDYAVICDESNNTPAVIDRNEFVSTVYFKPARSINFITLNFVATATGANFDELIGRQ